MILVVGTVLRGDAGGPGDPGDPPADGFRFIDYGEVTAALLAEARPEMVLSPLMGEGFDALDLARALAFAGFRGPYRALSSPLPDPDAVRGEIRAAAPGIDFDLLIVGGPLH